MALDRVLMIGWEYPPHNSGGLGVACQGLTEALFEQQTRIYFTLPYAMSGSLPHLEVLECVDPKWGLPTDRPPFSVYGQDVVLKSSVRRLSAHELHSLPGSELEQKVAEYADIVVQKTRPFKKQIDVIHAHDWMTLRAALAARSSLKVPVVAHIHSTEFDRIPHGYGSPYITHTEYTGLHGADKIIVVSNFTKQVLIDKYAVPEDRIVVVHNGIHPLTHSPEQTKPFASRRPVVVFMGRLTMQKGAEYFLETARQVVQRLPNTLFIVAGNGDQFHHLLLTTAGKQLSASLLFADFLRGTQREQLLDRADVFVMPSLSEPFGLVALEAAQRRTPVIMSKTSGASEVMPHARVIDFWDTQQMSQQILALLQNPAERNQVIEDQLVDIEEVTWEKAAEKIKTVYTQLK